MVGELPDVMHDRVGTSRSPASRYGDLEVATAEAWDEVQRGGRPVGNARVVPGGEHHRQDLAVPGAGCAGGSEHANVDGEEATTLHSVADRLRGGAELDHLSARDEPVVARGTGSDPVVEGASHRDPEPGALIQ